MAIPKYTQTVRDPGLGSVSNAASAVLYLGCSSAGTVYTIYPFSNASDVTDTLGQGPLPEDASYTLEVAGGPVYAMRMTGSTAGAAGAVTATLVGTATGTVTVAGAAYDNYDAIISIVTTGDKGAATFKYSLDNGSTYSPVLLIPSSGTFVLPNTNLTLTFISGAGAVFFQAGDTHTFTATSPRFSATELALAVTAIKAQNIRFRAVFLSGKIGTASASATVGAALATHATALFQVYQPMRFMMDAGTDVEATTQTAYAAMSSERIATGYGDERISSAKPFAGFGFPKAPVTRGLSARCAAIAISTDPARYAEGPIPGVISITHDEFRTENMDAYKFATMRTFQNQSGFYVCKVRLMSAAGSDYTDWQLGIVMDAVCNCVYDALLPFLSSAVRVNADGTMDSRDADRWEKKVNDALNVVIMGPDNAEGFKGHASKALFTVDRSFNTLSAKTVKGKVAVRPLGYADFITVELSYSANVGG